jgi:uncharacterized protein YqhQ
MFLASFRRFVRFSAHLHLMPILESGEEILVGGQAVMEGVMMRAPHSMATAVRRANGEIVIDSAPVERPSEKNSLWKLPILRGLATLGQALWLGTRALQFSAKVALDDENAKEGKVTKERKSNDLLMYGNIALTVLITIALYKWLPLKATDLLAQQFPVLQGQFANALVDGLIRLAIFGGVLFGLSRTKDINRVFEYHGAEHKVVFNYESGQPVTVDNAQRFVTWHPRCGTSFMLVVMVISMVLYMFVPVQGFWQKFALRVFALMPIVGISYEVIRYAAKNQSSMLNWITKPGLWLQRITTQPPSNEQAEVAIKALDKAMELEKAQGGQLVIA